VIRQFSRSRESDQNVPSPKRRILAVAAFIAVVALLTTASFARDTVELISHRQRSATRHP
jgi:hypothetical protein